MRKQIFRHGSKQAGFTLIELLVVIAIIGLLSTLAVVALNNARMKSRDARRVSDIKQIQTALELYYNDVNLYPIETTAVLLGVTADKTISSGGGIAAAGSGTTYMNAIPSNPTPVDATGGTGYMYHSADGSAYSITYYLGAATGGVPSGINTACSSGVTGCAF